MRKSCFKKRLAISDEPGGGRHQWVVKWVRPGYRRLSDAEAARTFLPHGAWMLQRYATVPSMPTATKPHLAIHAAVMSCVSRCAESDVPLVSLGDFLEELRGLGWSDKDIQVVGDTVLPMLGELKAGDTVRLGTTKMTAAEQRAESETQL